ncbi:hypothetical protein LBW89_26950 [Paenibacillus sp. alder61]|uniref:Uncharacterized protein n=1 Tax=Paenibacillus faecis TaxID=862114 RepID=A0A5D0CQW6_9BACL|nr:MULTISPECIES: hypothetical protein [Paenibacillus]MCA1296654.1 hypothetical protein [Paenibacillus sp. alder61]TYA11714.1 hypothetical protein FRY98_21615 [Paenibacillus faecis]
MTDYRGNAKKDANLQAFLAILEKRAGFAENSCRFAGISKFWFRTRKKHADLQEFYAIKVVGGAVNENGTTLEYRKLNAKGQLAIVLIFGLLMLVGCSKSSPNTVMNEVDHTMISYEQYRALFRNMAAQLELPSSKLIEKTDDINLVAIDKEFSLGKKSILTLDGEQSNTETQERIYYQDGNQVITVIDLIYLNASLGKDMIFWPTKQTNTYNEHDFLHNYDECMISYDNILVKISRVSPEGGLNFSEMQQTVQAVASYLQSYKP